MVLITLGRGQMHQVFGDGGLVKSVAPNGPFDRAGVKPGCRIVEVGGADHSPTAPQPGLSLAFRRLSSALPFLDLSLTFSFY